MLRRIVIWAGSFFVVSTIAFGVSFARFGIIADGQHANAHPFTASALALFVAYGMFHWALLSIMTLPIFLAPVLVWPFVIRTLPSIESNRTSMIIGLCCISVLAVFLRLGFLEYPGLLKTPLETVRAYAAAPSSYAEFFGMCLGLVLPRLCLRGLASGSFVYSR